ncbi:SDR family oxidoreductase [Cupriavidus sp. AU9028]|nr:SDR family oxidoreductase [Cupriavidus sp. AU9028]
MPNSSSSLPSADAVRNTSPSPAQRVAIVTGSSRGIGASIARRLAADGFSVAINYTRGSADAESMAAGLNGAGHRAIAVQADVSDSAAVARMFDTTEAELGKVDVLVNNAGMLLTAPLAEITDEQYARIFAINVQGSFNTMREAVRRLNDGGRIVNLSSTTLALHLPGYAIYNATKGAIEGMTMVVARELRGRRITVNAVAPGPVATELFLSGKTEEQIAHFSRMPPLERLGQPEDIAGVVAFLASPEGGWINGQVVRVNGGLA